MAPFMIMLVPPNSLGKYPLELCLKELDQVIHCLRIWQCQWHIIDEFSLLVIEKREVYIMGKSSFLVENKSRKTCVTWNYLFQWKYDDYNHVSLRKQVSRWYREGMTSLSLILLINYLFQWQMMISISYWSRKKFCNDTKRIVFFIAWK